MDEKGTIVSYGGGFKPPHKGHFNVIKRMIEKYPDAEVYNVFVGSKDRGGISQQNALDIWKIYKKYLSPKVSVRQSQIPITDVYGTAKENPDKNVIFAAGSRGEEDDKELLRRLSSYHKYDNLQLDVVRDEGGISATQLRKTNPDQLATFFPDELSDEDLEIVTNIVLGVNEDTTRTTKKGAPGTFKAKITKAYGGPVTIAKAKKFKNRKGATAHDKSQANWFINMHSAKEGFDPKLGKDPYGISQYSREIMEAKKASEMDPLFIKDIEKNYGEVDLENDYFNDELTRYYKTTDINKETGGITHDVINLPSFKDSFDKLKSAFASIKQLQTTKQVANDQKFPELVDKVKDAFNKYRTHLRTKYPSQYKTIKEEVDKMVNLLNEGVYDSITTEVSSDIFNAWKEFHDKYPDQEEFIYQKNYELQDKKGRDMEFDLQAKIVFKETEEGIYSVDGGAEEGDEDIQGELTVIFQVDPRDLPNMWSTISMDLKDVVRHEIEHLSQRGYNVVYSKEMEDNRALRALIKAKLLPDKEYYKLEDEIPAMLQGMYLKAKKSKVPFKDIIQNYFDKVGLSQEDRNEIIALWKQYLPSLSLPPIDEIIREQKEKIKFKRPKLNYSYTSLQPYIDKETMEEHFDKHFKGYTDKLNAELEEKNITVDAEDQTQAIQKILSKYPKNTKIRNNGGGFYNHVLYFENMTPDYKAPSANFRKMLEENFNSFSEFKEKFKEAGLGQFGSGWVFLIKKGNKLVIEAYPNQDNPYLDKDFDGKILIAMDVWEHSYYLKHKSKRGNYINDFFRVVDYKVAEERLEEEELLNESLWANINAKKKRGEKSSHKNSKAYKAAVKSGEKLKKSKLKEEDPKKGTGKKPEGSGRRLYTDENPKDTVKVKFRTKEDIVDTLNTKTFKSKSHARQSQVINLIHQRVRAAYQNAKDPDTKSRLKRAFDYITDRKEASKEKTKRLQKNEGKKGGGRGNVGSRYRAIEKRGNKFYYRQDDPLGAGVRQEFGPFKTKAAALRKMGEFPPATSYRDITEGVDNQLLTEFITFCCKKLGISDNFFVSLHSNRDKLQTLAQYNLVDNSIDVYVKDRLMADILRSIAHELVHHQQLENGDIDLNNMPQDIGGTIEDEANAVAGQLVKEFGYDNPEIFENIDPKAQKKHQKNPTAVPFGSAYSPVKEDGKEVSDKNMDDYKKSNIKEDNGKPKAIFMAGPAGSGKTYILNKLGIKGFTTINIDDEFEELLKKQIGKSRFADMSPEELSQAAKLMGQARKTTSAKLDKARESLTDVIIDGTGAASNPILKKKKQFEDLGYETFMILIYVSPITSLMRNKGRDRSLPPSAILQTWKGVAQNMEIYKKEFGDNIVLINNDPEDADKTFDDPQEIMKQFPSPKGKPKTPEEIEKAREKKKKLNQEIQDLLKIEREFDNTKDAKSKVMNFTKGFIKEEKEGKFNIYLDMDGVVADFDQRFIDLSGMLPKEFENKFGRKEFWNFIDEKNKLKFWVGIPEMSDAKQLVDYITPHGFQMLTAPSIKKQSYLGKMLWIKNHVGSLFSFKPYINFKKAKEKHNVKSNLTPNDILIDDREDTIDRWNAAGGTGVHHTSASSTINKLKKLGI
jgi:superoxide dismutase, Fe-Mn family